MRSTPSLRSFPGVAFEMVPVFVWLLMALSCPFKEDHQALPLFTLLSSRQLLVRYLPDNCWWDILGFVPSGSVWSSPLIFCILLQILLMLWAMQIIIIPSLVTTVGNADYHYPFPCHYCGQCKSSLSLPLSLLWAVRIIIIPSLVTTVGSANHHYPLSLLWAMQIIIIPCHYCGQCKSSLSLPLSLLWAVQIIIIPCHYCGLCKSSLSLPLSLLWAVQIIAPSLVTTFWSWVQTWLSENCSVDCIFTIKYKILNVPLPLISLKLDGKVCSGVWKECYCSQI